LRGVPVVTEGDAARDGAGLGRVEPMHRMRVADPFGIAWTNAIVDARGKSRRAVSIWFGALTWRGLLRLLWPSLCQEVALRQIV
jgi:hypothetical protein